jgi:hypothetical protein
MRFLNAKQVVFLSALLLPQLALGQAPPTGQTPSNPPPDDLAGVQVKDAYRYGQKDTKDKNDRTSASLGDIIIVNVSHLQALLDKSRCRKRTGETLADCHPQDLALFLDGRKIKGITPESGAPKEGEETLQFHLDRNADSDEAWADLLGDPPLDERFWVRPTAVSVGLENDYAIPTEVNKFNFHRVREPYFWTCLVIFSFLIVLLLWLAIKSDILRDSGPSPVGDRKPFSLARFQMAFWFMIVVGAFFFIWLVTGASDIITASTLALIGIASGTALGAAAIDIGKQQTPSSQTADLTTRQQALQTDVASLDKQIAADPAPANLTELQQNRTAKQTELEKINSQLAAQNTVAPQKTDGFLRDVLTDANGISFHRFQMFIWTLVLAVLFAYSVWHRLAMPAFAATLLALQGISAGTYLGFKIPETQAPSTDTQTPNK